jgi:hypothetical protein
LGDWAFAIGPGFQIGGEIDLFLDGVNDVAPAADQEHIVISEMLAKAASPVLKFAIISAVVGPVVGRLELPPFAWRERIGIDVKVLKRLPRLGVEGREGEGKILGCLHDARVGACGRNIRTHRFEIIFERRAPEFMKQPQSRECLVERLVTKVALGRNAAGKCRRHADG